MSINIFEATAENLDVMKGNRFEPRDGEGVVYLKLVMLKPDTMENGDPAKTVEDAKGVILCGQLNEIQRKIQKWFADSAATYRNQTTPKEK